MNRHLRGRDSPLLVAKNRVRMVGAQGQRETYTLLPVRSSFMVHVPLHFVVLL